MLHRLQPHHPESTCEAEGLTCKAGAASDHLQPVVYVQEVKRGFGLEGLALAWMSG